MKGFTLIELLVVVLIIGILSAVALPQYQVAVDKARAAQHWMMLKNLYDAQVRYLLANGTLAVDFNDIDITMPSGYTVLHRYVFRYPDGVEYHLVMSRPHFVGAYDPNLKVTLQQGLPTGDYHGIRYCIVEEGGPQRAHRLCKSMGGIQNKFGPRIYQIP